MSSFFERNTTHKGPPKAWPERTSGYPEKGLLSVAEQRFSAPFATFVPFLFTQRYNFSQKRGTSKRVCFGNRRRQ